MLLKGVVMPALAAAVARLALPETAKTLFYLFFLFVILPQNTNSDKTRQLQKQMKVMRKPK